MSKPGAARAQHDEYAMVGKYKVKGSAGEGVNGVVRLGIDTSTGQKVALKFMAKHALKPKQRDRLDREVRFLTLLHHPNIVELLDVVDNDQYIIFVMRHIRKGELLKYITDHGYLSESKFRPLFRAVLSAVDYCHKNSIVHRDLKPENILLDEHKEPKIIDFGLSNLYDNDHLLDTFCGSPKYAAPEIISGTKYLGPSVDVWSLGVILFAALCGTLPFTGSSIEKTYQRIMAGKITFPSHLSPEVKDYISRILKVDIAERMTVDEMLQHPWLNKGYDTPPSNFLPYRPPIVSDVAEDVLQQTVAFGYTREAVLEALHTPGMEPIKNTYFLIAERKERLEESKRERLQLLSDEHHGSFREKASGVFHFLLGSFRLRKHKLERDGFNLDLTYITDRMIRMAFPAPSLADAMGANPIADVNNYFERYHKDHFKVFNLVPGDSGGYDPRLLGGHVVRFPVQPQGPPFETMVEFCEAVDGWLNKEALNVVSVHGKGDYLRTAIMICAWLLHSGTVSTASEAIKLYNSKVFISPELEQAVPPSVLRYVGYYEAYVVHGKTMPPPKLFSLSLLVLQPVPEFDVYGGCDPIVKVSLNSVRVLKTSAHGQYATSRGDTHVVLECNTEPLSDDVYVRVLDKDRLGAEEMFTLRINLRFFDWCHHVEVVPRDTVLPAPTLPTHASSLGSGIPFVSTLLKLRAKPSVEKSKSDEHDTLAASSASPARPVAVRRVTERELDDDAMWKEDDYDYDSEDEAAAAHTHGRAVHPLERTHYDDSDQPAEPPSVAHHRQVSALHLDPYVASRVKLTFSKADLDTDQRERFPDEFSVTLLLKEPRLRRYTAEDIEATALAEAASINQH